MSFSRHSSTVWDGSPNWWWPKVTSSWWFWLWMGLDSLKASRRPSSMKRSKLSFCTEMRFGSSIVSGIFPKLTRVRSVAVTVLVAFAFGTRCFLLLGKRRLV